MKFETKFLHPESVAWFWKVVCQEKGTVVEKWVHKGMFMQGEGISTRTAIKEEDQRRTLLDEKDLVM